MPGKQALAAGIADWQQGRTEEALKSFAQAALADPQLAAAHGNLGVCLRKGDKVEAAIASYRRSLALNPNDPDINSNLGNSLREAGRLEDGERHLRAAFAAKPSSVSIANNLALILRDCRKYQDACALFEALTKACPGVADYAWDLALTQLYMRDYGNGFAGYESRQGLERAEWRALPGERWVAGGDVSGKTVLISAEQGFGDALQFARFFPMVARRAGRVIVEAAPELMDLFASIPGVSQVVERNAPLPPYDVWVPVMSLALVLGITWDTLPAEVPYLRAPQKMSLPRPPGTTRNVGLIWAGKPRPRDRSWQLESLLPLMEDPRLAFWSLQVGDRVSDLDQYGVGSLVRDLSPQLTSFSATAAAMDAMDVIVTVDTSAAHLAGALGRPTCVLLRYVSDWRWLDTPETCRWYPSLRLFRQANPQDVAGPVARIKAHLAAGGV
jgi:Tetratricopeptide repeat